MPRSKFATKAYGPTKPKICEDQQLPPGVLLPGPSATNTAHFLLVISDSSTPTHMVTGTAILTRQLIATEYAGTAFLGDYRVWLQLAAVGPGFAPMVQYTVHRGAVFITRGNAAASMPRSIDPYDTGILIFGPQTAYGQQMIRVVARA